MCQEAPTGDWIAINDRGGLRIVSPDGKRDRILNPRNWLTYGWSSDGANLYGIVSGENRRLMLGRVEILTGRETRVADLGPAPPALEYADIGGDLPYRGFSLHPDGKSFLTSVFRMKSDIFLLEDFDKPTRLWDRWWRR